jgi:hypothetical protein
MRSRRIAFGVLAAACVLLGGIWVLVASQNAGSTTSDARVSVAASKLKAEGRLLVRAVDPVDERLNGQVERIRLEAERGGATRLAGLECARVHMAGGRGLCLALAASGVDYRVRLFDGRHRVVEDSPLDGLPSRARVSPGGRYGAFTSFVSGHSYAADGGFSTQTLLVDMRDGRELANLEDFTATRDGRRIDAPDFNYWGVTFARDEDRFYATLATGGDRYLVEGSVSGRSVRVLRENVECPSLSPDGTRLAYKKRVGGPEDWRLHVLDLRTMRDTPLAERRSIDDQAEWLDDDVVLYGDGQDVWGVRSDGAGTPRRLLRRAASPTRLG